MVISFKPLHAVSSADFNALNGAPARDGTLFFATVFTREDLAPPHHCICSPFYVSRVDWTCFLLWAFFSFSFIGTPSLSASLRTSSLSAALGVSLTSHLSIPKI